jgi:hypothetical protein
MSYIGWRNRFLDSLNESDAQQCIRERSEIGHVRELQTQKFAITHTNHHQLI